jgi:hypothetical protein
MGGGGSARCRTEEGKWEEGGHGTAAHAHGGGELANRGGQRGAGDAANRWGRVATGPVPAVGCGRERCM